MKAGIVFLAGVGVGAALGVMLASQSGDETRDFIARQAGSGFDQASTIARKLRTRTGSLAEKAKGQAAEAVEGVKDAYHEKAGSL